MEQVGSISVEAFTVLVKPFFSSGLQEIYVACCCDRVYVGISPAEKCRTCQKVAKNRIVNQGEALSP